MMPVHSNEADGFAIAMIVIMVLAFGVIGTIVFTIFRNARKRNRDVEELMDEVEREEKKTRTPGSKKTGEPWERDGDWWKH